MSDRSPTESVGSIRAIRPDEDLPVHHAEFRRAADVQTATSFDLVEARPVESFRPIAAPLLIEPAEVRPPRATDTDRAPAPERPEQGSTAGVDEPRAAPFVDPAGPASQPRRDWLLDLEPQTTPAEVQPYGDDPVRLRELVQFFADGRVATAMVQAPRPAGDLVDAVPDAWERPLRLRTVLASERIR